MSADGHHTIKETVVDGISSVDEPSVGWGWHQHSRKVGVAVGGFFVLFLLSVVCMVWMHLTVVRMLHDSSPELSDHFETPPNQEMSAR